MTARAVDDSASLGLFLGRLERLNDAFTSDICRRHGITPAEFRVLAALRHAQTTEPMRPTDVARWVIQTSGGLTATLRRLENASYIERLDAADDARSRPIALTRTGTQFYDQLLDDIATHYANLFENVDLEAATHRVRELVDVFERYAHLPRTTDWNLSFVDS